MRPLPHVNMREPIARWLESSPHAYSRKELLVGWGRWDIDSAARVASIARVAPGVYAGVTHAQEPLVHAEAALLWCPSGLVTGEMALWLVEGELPVPEITDVVVPYGKNPRAPAGFRVLQRAPISIRSKAQGVPCVLPARALLDAWSLAPPERRKSIFYESLWAHATSLRAVARELRDVPRLRGRRALEALLKHFADGAMSPIEVFARTEVFVGPRWSEFELQAPLPGGYAADMLHGATKVIVELDGRRYHGKRDRAERDRIRDAELARYGYMTVRLSPRDLVDRPGWCRDVVADAVASRRAV